jgi:hypothetical protein
VLQVKGFAKTGVSALKFVGYNAAKQIVTEITDYTMSSIGLFQANLQDAKQEIRFVKIVSAN